MDLFEHLQRYDFKKEYTIKLRTFKDCISVQFFHFDQAIRDLLIDMSLKYLIDEGQKDENDMFLNYDKLCEDINVV